MTAKVEHYLRPLPPGGIDLNTVPVLKALASANRVLGELVGRASAIPNQEIFVDTLALQEACVSSAIENIVTTQDELFQADSLSGGSGVSAPAKEVMRYRRALKKGYRQLVESGRQVTEDMLIEIYREIMDCQDGFRKQPVYVGNRAEQGVVYTPPKDPTEVAILMRSLLHYVNDDSPGSLDPLVRMALIHLQFESIHPFSDGNGRMGRILNVLYLTKMNTLDSPVLYLSRMILPTKERYYQLFRSVQEDGAWEDWVLYMLAVAEDAFKGSLQLVTGIRELMMAHKSRMREALPKLYSRDILNNLFRHPYTRVQHVQRELEVSRATATRWLGQLANTGFVEKRRVGRGDYYVNTELCKLLLEASRSPESGSLMQISS